LIFGTVMASVAAATLLSPGTALDRIWALNKSAYRQLAPWGRPVGIAFLIVGVALALAAAGWFRRRPWGWWLTVVIIATQMLGDFVNVFAGHLVKGGIGMIVAGALMFYLLRPAVRAAFRKAGVSDGSARPISDGGE
jgi:hypothetical protein